MSSDLTPRVDDLARRVALLEKLLWIPGSREPLADAAVRDAKAVAAPSVAGAVATTSAVGTQAAPTIDRPFLPDDVPLGPWPETPPLTPAPPALPLGSGAPAAARSSPPTLAPAMPARAGDASRADRLEKLIGGRWYAALGALIVVAGIGLFLKLAWDQGWFKFAPIYRCLAGALFGGVLIAAGEVIRRRYAAWAAMGLYAAGLGSVFASAYAAYRLYALFTPPVGFVVLALTAALGIGLGVRVRFVAVSILSLLAGYLTPLLFLDAPPRPYVLPAYLFTLLVIGLTLSIRLCGTFTHLRRVVWWGTFLLGSFWTLSRGDNEPIAALAFLAASWTAIHSELYLAVRPRGPIPDENATEEELEVSFPRLVPKGWPSWRPLISSLSTTVWAVFFGVFVLRFSHLAPDWLAPAAATAACAGLAFALAGHLRAFRDRPRTDAERLGASLFAQAGTALAVLVAIAFTGWAEVLTWIFVGAAALAAARWLRSRAFDIYGLIFLSIGTARLLIYDSWSGPIGLGGERIFGLYLSTWTLLVVLSAGLWLGAGLTMRRTENRSWRSAGHALAGLGCILAYFSVCHEESSRSSIVIAGVVLGLGTTELARFLRSRALSTAAGVILALAGTLALSTRWWDNLSSPAIIAHDFRLTALALVPAVVGITWLIFAARLTSRTDRSEPTSTATPLLPESLAWLATLAGVFLLFASVGHRDTSTGFVCAVWIVLSLLIAVLHRGFSKLALDVYAFVGLAASFAAWLAFPISWDDSTWPLVLHPGLLLALPLAASGVGLAEWWRRRHPQDPAGARTLRSGAWAIGVSLLLVATSLEVGRIAQCVAIDQTAERSAVSIWWAVFAAGLLVAGFVLKQPASRRCGLALLGAAAAKALIIDLAEVPAGWRVASFLGIGLLMLGVAVVYSRLSAAEQAAGRSPASTAT